MEKWESRRTDDATSSQVKRYTAFRFFPFYKELERVTIDSK